MFKNYFPFTHLIWLPIIIILVLWTLCWKAMALWRAARKGDKPWFIVLMIVNTLGILEIFYIYIWSRPRSLLEKVKDKLGQ